MGVFSKCDGNSRFSGDPARSRRSDRVRFRPLMEPLGSRALLSQLDPVAAAVVPATTDVGTTSDPTDATDEDLTSTDDGSASTVGASGASASSDDTDDTDDSDPTDSDDSEVLETSDEVETEVEVDG
jgi:hypothetical protein